MARNSNTTKQTKLRGIMASKIFNLGVEDYRKGLPLREVDLEDEWTYERGRLFAAIYKGPVKENRRVTYDAIVAFSVAYSQRIII